MAAPITSTDTKIPVTFWFQGETESREFKGLSVGVIDIKIQGAKSTVSVSLPKDGLTVSEARRIEFRHTQRAEVNMGGKKTWINLKETHPEALSLRVDQVKNMTLVGGFFEPGRPFGPITMYPDGRRHQQQTVIRTDRSIDLTIPDTFENGAPHRLIVTSDNLELSARLVPENSATR